MNAQTASTTQSQHLVPRVAEADSGFSRNYPGLLASLGFAALLCGASLALAATAPPLGVAGSFAVLGATPDVKNTGPTVVTGDLGVSPAAAVIGFPPGIVIGTIHPGDATAASAQSDNTTAYGFLAGEACNTSFAVPTDLTGMTLVPGVYCFASSASNTGLLKLDAGGNPNAVWVFKTVSTLITGSGSSVVLINGGQDCNVFWQVGSSATLFTTTTFVGNILALTSITMQTGATLSGRALAQTGEVTLDSNSVSVCSLSQPPPPGTPTLGKVFSPATINAGGVSTLTITLSNPNVAVATLTAPLIDTLPTGVVIAATPNVSTTCGGVGAPVAVAGGSTVTLPAGRSIPANGSCTLTVNVTAAVGGSYIDTLLTGALVTSNGNNAAPAVATLTVVPLGPTTPTLGKAFSPATINAGGVSTLTITLSNPNVAVATLTAPLIDTLPTGVVIAATPNVSTTCGGVGAPVAVAGGSTVTLPAGRSIPANGSCTLTVNVTAPFGGSFLNTLAVGVLQTTNGNNAAPAVATLTVVPPVPGSITINKVATGGNTTFNFTSTVPGNAAFPITTVSGNGSITFSSIAPGTYTVTETVPSGWSLTALTCTDPTNDSTGNVGTRTATINLAAAESVSCTFTDNLPAPPPPPPLTIIPTLGEWALIMLAMLLLVTGWLQYRRRQ